MGHSSRSCGLTGLPIRGGDKMVLVPLILTSRYNNSAKELKKYGTTCFISNEGANVLFKPAMFPIFGVYDEYGGMDEIEEDDNTKVLEKYYDLTIKQIVDIICSGRKDDGYDDSLKVIKKTIAYPEDWVKGEKHFARYQRLTGDKQPFNGHYPDVSRGGEAPWTIWRDGRKTPATKEEYDADMKLIHEQYARYKTWTETNPDPEDDYGKPLYEERYKPLVSYSGMFMRREIYDGLALIKSKPDDDDGIDIGIPAILKALGFEQVGDLKEGVRSEDRHSDKYRYNLIFKKGKVKLFSDGNWVNAGGRNEGLYTLHDLKKHCSKKGEDIDITDMVKKNSYEQIYDYILPETNSINREGRWEGDRLRGLFMHEGVGGFDFDEETLKELDALITSKAQITGDTAYFTKLKQKLAKKNKPLSALYFEEAKRNGNGYLRKNMVDWHTVYWYFYFTGKFLSPTSTAPQDGEPKMVLELLKLSQKVLKSDLKK